MPTTRDVIARAARAVGVLASGETFGAAEEQDCLAILQRLRNSWGAQKGTIYEERRTTHNLINGTRDYTIGTGGTINIARPVFLERAGFIMDRTATEPLERPIAVYTPQDWARVALKTFTSNLLDGIYLDYAFSAAQLATLSTYPTISTAVGQLVLYVPMAVTGFEALTTNYLFPPGYEDAFHYNLAMRIGMEFPGSTIPPGMRELAAQALQDIKSANHRPVALGLDASVPGLGGRGGYANGRRIIDTGGSE